MSSGLDTVLTPTLEVGYLAAGPLDGRVVVLLHGFPYGPHAYDEVAETLGQAGWRVIMPFLRGYGPTRFRDSAAFRSGQQAALGQDLAELIDALELEAPLLAGYDWGGRAACVVAALRPERVGGLVSVTGYNIFGAPRLAPEDPIVEQRNWYQHYLLLHRGRQMLVERRRDFARQLWRSWSPSWDFSEETFDRTAEGFDNPDFVDVVLHSYRHRHGVVAGDPALSELEARCVAQPTITVPSVVLHGDEDFQPPSLSENAAEHFSGRYERRIVPGVGHNLPQEDPAAMVDAVLTVSDWMGG